MRITAANIMMVTGFSALIGATLLLSSCGADRSAFPEPQSSQQLQIFTEAETESAAETETTVAETTTVSSTTKTKSTATQTTSAAAEDDDTVTTAAEDVTESWSDYDDGTYVAYHFRSKKLLNSHFEKHGDEFAADFGYQSAEEYEQGASDVINNPDALYKTEAEDGDGVYYIEATNEFVILSTDGYIRTYFRPDAGIKYFNKQ